MDSIFNYEHPFVCTDATIFSIETQESISYRKLPEKYLNIRLYKQTSGVCSGMWCLPGGFLNIDELPEDNIRRKLYDKANIMQCFLEQLYTFCDVNRDPRARVISIAYLGLMNEDTAKMLGDKGRWFRIQIQSASSLFLESNDLIVKESELGFDHYKIIKTAIERLRIKITYSDMIFNLLPERFTLTELQQVYETILQKKELAANFRRKMMCYVEETGEYLSEKGHRPAMLFRRKQQEA